MQKTSLKIAIAEGWGDLVNQLQPLLIILSTVKCENTEWLSGIA